MHSKYRQAMGRKKTDEAGAAAAAAPASAGGAAPGPAAPPKPPADAAEGTDILQEAPEVFQGFLPTIKIGKPHPSPAVESGLLSRFVRACEQRGVGAVPMILLSWLNYGHLE
jgi:hypothetical protein